MDWINCETSICFVVSNLLRVLSIDAPIGSVIHVLNNNCFIILAISQYIHHLPACVIINSETPISAFCFWKVLDNVISMKFFVSFLQNKHYILHKRFPFSAKLLTKLVNSTSFSHKLLYKAWLVKIHKTELG